MDSSRRMSTKALTVKNVQTYMMPFDERSMHSLQQMLSIFGVAPKLERILWAILKKEYLRRKVMAETLTYGGTFEETDPTHRLIQREALERKAQAAAEEAALPPTPKKPRGPRVAEVVEPEKLTTIISLCTCGRLMMGKPIAICSKIKKQPIFYQECEHCTRYVEVWRQIKKHKTVYYEVEGGE